MQVVKRVRELPTSYLREILAAADVSRLISLAGGLPSLESFPLRDMQQVFNDLTGQPELFQYAQSRGYPPLLAYLAQRYELDEKQGLLMTNGSQQGLDLLVRAYLNPGDKVAVEAPSYLGALQVFRLAGANLQAVPQLADGPDLEALERVFAAGDVKMFYAIADFHNPTGVCYSLAVRRGIAQLCRRYGVLLIEDVPYRELRFSGEHQPLISDFCPECAVVMRSFSKIVCPGLRLGVVHGPTQWIDQLLRVKQICDLQTNQIMQHVLLNVLQQSHFESHLGAVRAGYRKQYKALRAALDKHLGGAYRAAEVEGGMFIWIELLGERALDMSALAERCLAHGVAVVPGSVFYIAETDGQYLRLNFSGANCAQLDLAVQRLAAAVEAFN
ncbi:MAG: PLP-dependent aminotransferase family protein [Pseudomonadales bacterium]